MEMSVKARAIYINIAIFIGLLLELLWGRPLLVIGISAGVLFIVANVAFLIAAKRKHKKTG